MITVIICSANEQDLNNVKENITQTIGLPFEIIAINNSDGKMGICEVYNRGASQAQYETLCFMHEDIEMITPNWGKKVIELFDQNPKVGLMGVAGGGYKSLVPSSWYHYKLEQNGGFYVNIIQGHRRSGKPDSHDYKNPKNERFSKVACIDGCWMCIRAGVWKENKFDENRLTKFHAYDLDISMAVNQKSDVIVTFEVLLRHFSEGNFDQNWFLEILKINDKWCAHLPLDADKIVGGNLFQMEKRAYRRFLQESLNEGFSKTTLLNSVWSTRKSPLFGFGVMLKLAFSLLKMKAVKLP